MYDTNYMNVSDSENGSDEGSVRQARKTADELVDTLEHAGSALRQLCDDSEPRFIIIGRDLQAVFGQARTLTDTIKHAAKSLQGEREKALDSTGTLIREIQNNFSEDKQEIDHDLVQIRNLMHQISDCHRINDGIDKITTSFKAIRINIRIQCSARHISDSMFKDVTEDIDKLSRNLSRITGQVKNDISVAVKKLDALEKDVADSLMDMVHMSTEAQNIANKSHSHISHLMQGINTIMDEAESRSEVVVEKVNEIVVSIQFHDSLSQRINHIIHAFKDIIDLCKPTDSTPGQMGTACLIIDLQHRQLEHIIAEITTVHDRFQKSFNIIGQEVNGLNSILFDTQFKVVKPDQFLRDFYSSLSESLRGLSVLLSRGEEMIDRINSTVDEIKTIISHFSGIVKDVEGIRQETRLQAVNTIIMAGNLGEQGRTIQVLAREINVLSEKTGELVKDVEMLQSALEGKVEKLSRSWKNNVRIGRKQELDAALDSIDQSYRSVAEDFSDIQDQISGTDSIIDKVSVGLPFLQELHDRLWDIAEMIGQERDKLSPWKESASHNSDEVEQLVKRYTMSQERLIHMFDRGDSDQGVQTDDDIFF